MRVWILMEWIDENNMIPTYGIVNVDTACYKEDELQPGKKILISMKLNEPRLAKIIRIAEKKSHVLEHKEFLERQDQQVKNVLQMCMHTIKEMKSEQYSGIAEKSVLPNKSLHHNLPHIIPAHSENSASDDDSELNQIVHQGRVNKLSLKRVSHPQNKRIDTICYRNRPVHSPVTNQRRRSVISSTPLPGIRSLESVKLCFDQGTQTDNTFLQPPLAKIEEMELVLKQLYARFHALVMKVNNSSASIDISEPEQNDVSYMELMPIYNEAWVPNNITESVDVGNTLHSNNNDEADDGIVQPTNHSFESKSLVNVKVESDRSIKENPMRVRRMSAQTTETEMISIGDGKATVPERLFNDIDWNSYTTATRQLLQAIFPRKVLATHSLTGKPSPAHLHKPPKKLLDPVLVDDIVKTVSVRCGVPKNLVRNSITVKCTDEAKLYRNRQRHRQAQNGLQNEENVPPSTTPSSDESANLVS